MAKAGPDGGRKEGKMAKAGKITSKFKKTPHYI
jgi:hypothetical protein